MIGCRLYTRSALYQAMRWTPNDVETVPAMMMWLELDHGLKPAIVDGHGDRCVLGIQGLWNADMWTRSHTDIDWRIEPGNWVVIALTEFYPRKGLKVYSDDDFLRTFRRDG
jgi:hypothetical protein